MILEIPYDGGPASRQYCVLQYYAQRGILPGIEVTDEGWVRGLKELTEGWETVDGLSRPIWPSCGHRILCAKLGNPVTLYGDCHVARPEGAKCVTMIHCQQCPLRQAITGEPPLPPPRPDLAAIELTLPASTSNRTFQRPTFHDDGSIEYPKGEKEPLDIDGYVRDSSDAWLFHPLWNKCALRHQVAFFKAACGCLSLVSRCNNPAAPEFAQRVSHTICESCPVRKE